MGTDLTISKLARRSSTTVSALHFYERQGLPTPARSAGNQRRYPECAVHLVGVMRVIGGRRPSRG